MVQAMSPIALTTWASLMVRSGGGRVRAGLVGPRSDLAGLVTQHPAARVACVTIDLHGVDEAQVVNAIGDIAWTINADALWVLAAECLYGRRKMTAYLRRTTMPTVSSGAVDRAMRILGLSGVRRDKAIRTTIPAKDGKRAGDLLDRDFTADVPNQVWVTDFTYRRSGPVSAMWPSSSTCSPNGSWPGMRPPPRPPTW